MRKELRSRHDDRMRKIQDAADKGKIRRIIKQIIGGDKEFSLEVLYNEVKTLRMVMKLRPRSMTYSVRAGSSNRKRKDSRA